MSDRTVRAAGREAPLQELGHGEDLRAHVERDHDPAQDEQAPGVELVVGHGHAVGRARAGQADEVLGADVRGEDGGADDEPAEVAAGQEVLGRGLLLLAHDLPGDAEDDHEIDEDDDPVEGFQYAHVRSFSAGCTAAADSTPAQRPLERAFFGKLISSAMFGVSPPAPAPPGTCESGFPPRSGGPPLHHGGLEVDTPRRLTMSSLSKK